jgi:hypothetical protein
MNKTLPALPGKAPALPPGAFEIGYTARDGAQHRVPLAEAAVVRFADAQPARRIRTRKGQRHLPGRWWSATDGRHIGYESWLERDQLMWLDWDRAVTGTASQPFRLRWATEEGEPRSHVPDYFAERGGGPPVVVDCRPADRYARTAPCSSSPSAVRNWTSRPSRASATATLAALPRHACRRSHRVAQPCRLVTRRPPRRWPCS